MAVSFEFSMTSENVLCKGDQVFDCLNAWGKQMKLNQIGTMVLDKGQDTVSISVTHRMNGETSIIEVKTSDLAVRHMYSSQGTNHHYSAAISGTDSKGLSVRMTIAMVQVIEDGVRTSEMEVTLPLASPKKDRTIAF